MTWKALGAALAAVVVAGCGAQQRFTARKPQVRITVDAGCASRLGKASDVHNTGDDLADRFAPPGPTAGLICRYDQRHALYREATLDAARARTLADDLNRVKLDTAKGNVECPVDWGTAAILVFGYHDRADVDVWYHDSGCASVDNGARQAAEVANPPFYQTFMPAVERLARGCAKPPHSC